MALRGVADRIDLLPGRRLRVIDYKSGSAPQAKLALQAPIYALCAQERLSSRDGAAWSVDEAAYVSLRGPRTLVPIVKAGSQDAERLAEARGRVHGRAGQRPRRRVPAAPAGRDELPLVPLRLGVPQGLRRR